jgi:hypothetical protein
MRSLKASDDFVDTRTMILYDLFVSHLDTLLEYEMRGLSHSGNMLLIT